MKNRYILIVTIATLACFALSYTFAKVGGLNAGMFPYPVSVGNQYFSNRPKYPVVETKQSIAVTKDTVTLSIDGVQSDITLIPSDGNQIEADLKIGADRKLMVKETPDEVNLKVEGEHNTKSQFGLFTTISPGGTLEVKIPKTIQNLKVHLVSGNMVGDGLSFKSVELKNTSGDIRLKKANLEKAEMKSVSGWVGIEGVVQEMTGDLVSGEFRLYLDNPAPKLNLKTVSGDTKVRLTEKADATVSSSFVSGTFTVKNQGQKKLLGRGAVIFGKGTGSVEIHTTSGNVTIE